MVDEGTKTAYGCANVHLEWQECVVIFGITATCDTKRSDSYVDPDCVKQKATAAGMITMHMYNQNYIASVVNIRNSTNQGMYYAKSAPTDQVFPAPVINGNSGTVQLQTDGVSDTVQNTPLNIQSQRLASQTAGLETAPQVNLNLGVDLSNNDTFYKSLNQGENNLKGSFRPVLQGNNPGVTADMLNQTTAFVSESLAD